MKRLLISSLIVIVMVNTAISAVVITDDFEVTNNYGNWTSGGAASVWSPDPFDASGSIRLDTEVGAGESLTLTIPLNLVTQGATSVTIQFTGGWGSTGSGTRYFNIEYSNNNGASWTSLAQINSNQTANPVGYTVAEENLSDEFFFRFRPKDDGNNNANDWSYYLENTVITHDGVAVPEPTTVMLIGLSALLIGRRRRA